MKKAFLSFIFLPLVISNTNSASVETVVRNEVFGENASIKTEITNKVNQDEVKVESDKPGEIKVEVKNGEVKIETTPAITPTITISKLSEEEVKKTEEEAMSQIEEIKTGLFSFFENLFSKISRVFHFTP